VSRRCCWRAPVSDREPIVTERESEALSIVSEREPKPKAVGEPDGLCLQAATGSPEHLVPVAALAFRQVADEAQVLPVRLPAQGLALIGGRPSARVVVGGDDEARPLPHLFDGGAEQGRLVRIHRPAGAGVAGGRVGVQHGVGERVDAALGNHEAPVPSPRKAGEAPDPAGKARGLEQATGDRALLLTPAMEGERIQRKVVKP
jgi:hypothetical protein